MQYAIKVTPRYVTDPSDQVLINTPHYVGESLQPSFKGDPIHSRVVADLNEAIKFDSPDAANKYADLLGDKNKSHHYDVVEVE